MNPQPMMTPPPRPGWWKRNWKWFVPVSLFCLLLFAVAIVGLILTIVMGSIKNSVPYTRAMAHAKADPTLIAQLGTPIEAGWFVTGSMSSSGSNSHADLNIPIHGPKGSGTLHVIALKSPFVAGMDNWKLTVLEAKVDGRTEVITLNNDDTPPPTALTQDDSGNAPRQVQRETVPPGGSGIGQGVPGGAVAVTQDEAPEPPPAGSTKNLPKIVSGGVLNGRAINLPEPPYPAVAKAAGAKGTVIVQVTVDEDGKVVSASAISGHPLLRAGAELAARGARFTPTKLSGQQVKVSGVITYNFNP
jgi:TonB family protein